MIDIFILILLLWAAFSGWRSGFLKEVVSTVGFLVGLFVAASCYKAFGEYLAVNGSESNMLTSIIAFLLLWVIVPIVLGLVANILTKALQGMQLGLPNSILGAAVSVTKYLILMSCVLNVMETLHIMNTEKSESSHLYKPVTGALQFLSEGQHSHRTHGRLDERKERHGVDNEKNTGRQCAECAINPADEAGQAQLKQGT